ncbi:hypothetical protein AB0F81_20410 [Actinoplanes sp. NPDC024001]|uniref:CdiA C-terminal domain-containing protein n=1 Tax=Actinoplanes sp. NPDC024001 TaxID=3154598 RepID=UPI0033FDB149
MENSAAALLADQGYRIKQNPEPAEVAGARHATGDSGLAHKQPDYLVEGRVFDCYSPTSHDKPVRGIWTEVESKVLESQRQTQRVVVNLEDWRGDLASLRQQFRDWPIEGLKELKVITADGETLQIDLPDLQNGT